MIPQKAATSCRWLPWCTHFIAMPYLVRYKRGQVCTSWGTTRGAAERTFACCSLVTFAQITIWPDLEQVQHNACVCLLAIPIRRWNIPQFIDYAITNAGALCLSSRQTIADNRDVYKSFKICHYLAEAI